MRKSLLDFCLETGRDELLSQWDEHLNGPLTAADITYGSKRKVWWRCAKGHEWQASAGSRTIKDTGCPVCAGNVSQKHQHLHLSPQTDAERRRA